MGRRRSSCPRSTSGAKFAPAGYTHLREFWRDTGVHFAFDLGSLQIEKAVYLVPDRDVVLVEYTFHGIQNPIDFVLRPFVGLRDFHQLQQSNASLMAEPVEAGVLVRHELPSRYGLLMDCPANAVRGRSAMVVQFHLSRQYPPWPAGQRRPLDPGLFSRASSSGTDASYSQAHLGERGHRDALTEIDVDTVKSDLARRRDQLLRQANARDETEATLVLAADQFVVTRQGDDSEKSTIVAGYPWFADWGRDAFVALPGLFAGNGADMKRPGRC